MVKFTNQLLTFRIKITKVHIILMETMETMEAMEAMETKETKIFITWGILMQVQTIIKLLIMGRIILKVTKMIIEVIWFRTISKKKMPNWKKNSMSSEKWSLVGSERIKIISKKKSLSRITTISMKRKRSRLKSQIWKKDTHFWKEKNSHWSKN